MENEGRVTSGELVYRYSLLQERLTDPGFREFMDDVIRDDVSYLNQRKHSVRGPYMSEDYGTRLNNFINTMVSHNAEVTEADGVTVIGLPTTQPERHFMAEAVRIVQERREKVEKGLGITLPPQVVYMGSGQIMEESYRVLGEPDMKQPPYALASGRSCYVNMNEFGKIREKKIIATALYHEAGHVILNMIMYLYGRRGFLVPDNVPIHYREAFAGPLDLDAWGHIYRQIPFGDDIYISHSGHETVRERLIDRQFYDWFGVPPGQTLLYFQAPKGNKFARFCVDYWGNEVNVLRDLRRIQDPTDLNTRYQVPIDLSCFEQIMLPRIGSLLRTPYTAVSSRNPVGTITWPRHPDQPARLFSQVVHVSMLQGSLWQNQSPMGNTCSALVVQAEGSGPEEWNVFPHQFVPELAGSGILQLNHGWDKNRLTEAADDPRYLVFDPFTQGGFITLK